MDDKDDDESLLIWLLRQFPSMFLYEEDFFDSVTECTDSVVLRLGVASVTIQY
jgi:hypothetical protein